MAVNQPETCTDFDDLERRHMSVMEKMPQELTPAARRIACRVQAGFNYAMGQEVLGQGSWNLSDAVNGLAYGMVCTWLMVMSSASPDERERILNHLHEELADLEWAKDDPDQYLEEMGSVSADQAGRA